MTTQATNPGPHTRYCPICGYVIMLEAVFIDCDGDGAVKASDFGTDKMRVEMKCSVCGAVTEKSVW